MVVYITIGFIYIFGVLSWLYLIKNETLTYSDLLQGVALIFFWPILLAVQLYAWSFHYDDKVFLKGNKDDELL